MVPCKYHKLCLKDISQLPKDYKIRITKLLFEDIPLANTLDDCRLDIYPIKGMRDHYRVRVGKYRIGVVIEAGVVIFARVKSREEIDSVFP